MPSSGDPATYLRQLVTAVANGDRQAFAALYDELSPMVHGTALRVLRDGDLAAEVTQDVLVETWRNAGQYTAGRGSVRAWVATMAHRRAVDRVRAVQAQRTRDERYGLRDYRPAYDDVAEQVEGRAERDRVHGCLQTLTDRQRDAVIMAYFDGRTYREVADDVGSPLPTVKSRIRDGLNRLRHCLGVA